MSWLVLGLGNPGSRYAGTRHNVGWLCLDEVESRGEFGSSRRDGPAHVRSGRIGETNVLAARPTTFMNESGKAGAHLTSHHRIPLDHVVVVHDDMDLPLGRVRLKFGGSSAGQRGVDSLMTSWRSKDFFRIRVGIGRPPEGRDPVDYVLERFTSRDRLLVDSIAQEVVSCVEILFSLGPDEAMRVTNSRSSVAT